MNKKLKLALITVIASLGTFSAAPARADRYQAGEFTLDITASYRGCDSKGNCLFLDKYQKWKENGRRGTFWINGDYTYGISWRENRTDEPMLFTVRKKGKKLFEHKMVRIDR